jgi:hypothetical protein
MERKCPECAATIAWTSRELVSCPCGTHFSSNYPEIRGKDKVVVAQEIKRHRNNLWMKRDREMHPEKYKEKDKTKFKRRLEDPEKAEKHRERERLRHQKRRANEKLS